MEGIKKIIEYLNESNEIESFEEQYDVEFPTDSSLLEQIEFVTNTENLEHDADELNKEERLRLKNRFNVF